MAKKEAMFLIPIMGQTVPFLEADTKATGQYHSISKLTLENYNSRIKFFNTWLAENELNLNEESIKRFFEEKIGSNPSNTQHHFKMALKKAFLASPMLASYRLEIIDIFNKIKTTKKNNENKPYLEIKEIKKLVNFARKHDEEDLALIIQFLFQTGARYAEMAGLRIDSIKENGKSAYFSVKGKGNKERTCRIDKKLYKDILGYFDGEVFLFELSGKPGKPLEHTRLFRHIRKLGEDVLNKNIGPHIFRHSFAMDLKNQGWPQEDIKVAMGHSSVAITIDHYFNGDVSENDIVVELERKQALLNE
jgi:integrase